MYEYTVKFTNDMGHLITHNSDKLPAQVLDFAHNKIKNKIIVATDKNNLGCRFYILKNGLQKRWTYTLGNMSIMLDYSDLDKFNSKTMTI